MHIKGLSPTVSYIISIAYVEEITIPIAQRNNDLLVFLWIPEIIMGLWNISINLGMQPRRL